MPYEKLSKQLDEKGEGTSNDVVGPIIDEPIPDRVRRLDIKGKLNPELWILSVYMILELISVKSVPFLVNHMLAFEDKQCSWAYCSLVSREFGFIDKEVRPFTSLVMYLLQGTIIFILICVLWGTIIFILICVL